MALTRDFKDTVMERAKQDAAFRKGLLTRGISYVFAGAGDEDLQLGKSLIRDYINATIGFGTLAKKTGISKPSLMQMLGPRGNPTISSFHIVLAPLLAREGLKSAAAFPAFLADAAE